MPTEAQWQAIKTELEPILAAAGFTPNYPPEVPQPATMLNVISPDGSMFELGSGGLLYDATTGCRPVAK